MGINCQEVLLGQLEAGDTGSRQHGVHGGQAFGIQIKGKNLSESRTQQPKRSMNILPSPRAVLTTAATSCPKHLSAGQPELSSPT